MNNIYTIGFTKKSAETFFELLINNRIEVLLDVRLNNTSQLAGFSKYPDIEYFLKNICNIKYISDTTLAPEEWILKDYKNKKMSWEEYVENFGKLMEKRNIQEHILENYKELANKRICLLCSEEKSDFCHRSLVAEYFKSVFGSQIVNL